MSILSDLGSGSFSSADGPDWLISNDDVRPVSNRGFDGIELCLKNIICSSSFSLFKSLSNTKNGFKSCTLSLGYLTGNDIICLTEELSSLGVSYKSPLKSKINNLLGTDLASKCAVAACADVLGGYEHIRVEHSLCRCDMKSDGGDNNLNTVRIEFHGVQSIRADSANKIY